MGLFLNEKQLALFAHTEINELYRAYKSSLIKSCNKCIINSFTFSPKSFVADAPKNKREGGD